MGTKVRIMPSANEIAPDDCMINKNAKLYHTCEQCGSIRKEYYAFVKGKILCGNCIYQNAKKNS